MKIFLSVLVFAYFFFIPPSIYDGDSIYDGEGPLFFSPFPLFLRCKNRAQSLIGGPKDGKKVGSFLQSKKGPLVCTLCFALPFGPLSPSLSPIFDWGGEQRGGAGEAGKQSGVQTCIFFAYFFAKQKSKQKRQKISQPFFALASPQSGGRRDKKTPLCGSASSIFFPNQRLEIGEPAPPLPLCPPSLSPNQRLGGGRGLGEGRKTEPSPLFLRWFVPFALLCKSKVAYKLAYFLLCFVKAKWRTNLHIFCFAKNQPALFCLFCFAKKTPLCGSAKPAPPLAPKGG